MQEIQIIHDETKELYKLDYIAKQASASLLYQNGKTVILASIAIASKDSDGDFVPFSVQYIEKAYAVGRFPGGFVKREGKPAEFEILTSRIIDRTLRPLFPKTYRRATHLSVFVLSYDGKSDLQIDALNAAANVLLISEVPFKIPVAGVRVGYVDGSFVLNPTPEMLMHSTLDLLVSGSLDDILMIEMKGASSDGIDEERLLEAICIAKTKIKAMCVEYNANIAKYKKPTLELDLQDTHYSLELETILKERYSEELRRILNQMAKSESNILYRRLLRSYFSSVISISLVLFLVGMAGVLIVNARSVSNYFKENITVSAVLTPEADEADASALADELDTSGYVKDVRIISKEEGTEEMKEILGDDFMDVFEVNPIPVSLELQIAADYISTDSLSVIENSLRDYPAVDDVVYQQSLVELLNANLERIGLVAGVFVLLLLFISVVLINNTVRLNVYSKRFTIHTMRMVGATKGFITRPFVGQAFFQGLISGAIADVFILGALYLIRNEFYQLFSLFDAVLLGGVMAAVLVLGMIICMVSTSAGVRSMISLSRNELYY